MAQRLLISDATVARLPYATSESGYIARDRKVGGFHVRVGQTTKTYRLQMDVREGGRRITRSFPLGKHPHTKADAARAKALDIIQRRARDEPLAGPIDRGAMTFTEAWRSYEALLKKKKRSPGTIADYQDKCERHLKRFHGTPLRSITRAAVVALHSEVTASSGPYAANGTMRVGHATSITRPRTSRFRSCRPSIHFAGATCSTRRHRARPAWARGTCRDGGCSSKACRTRSCRNST